METTDKIIKALECCSNNNGDCHACPYPGGKIGNLCFEVVCADALALIRQFERERDFLLQYLTDSRCVPCDICKHEPENGGIMNCKRVREIKGPCFEWRGLCAENGGIEND